MGPHVPRFRGPCLLAAGTKRKGLGRVAGTGPDFSSSSLPSESPLQRQFVSQVWTQAHQLLGVGGLGWGWGAAGGRRRGPTTRDSDAQQSLEVARLSLSGSAHPAPQWLRGPEERGGAAGSQIQISTITTTEVTGTLQCTTSCGMSGPGTADFQMWTREAQRSHGTCLRSLCCPVSLDPGLEASSLSPT